MSNPIEQAVNAIHYRFTSGSEATPEIVASEKAEIRAAINCAFGDVECELRELAALRKEQAEARELAKSVPHAANLDTRHVPAIVRRLVEFAWEMVEGEAGTQSAAQTELAHFRTTVDKLPKTADGVPVVPGMIVFVGPSYCMLDLWPVGSPIEMNTVGGHDGEVSPGDCYSTLAAAQAAEAGKGKEKG